MNITNSILPSFLYGIDSSGITTTNRYVNVNGEDRPVVQKTVRGTVKNGCLILKSGLPNTAIS